MRRLVFGSWSPRTRVRAVGAAVGAAVVLAAVGAYGLTRSSGTAGARPHAASPLVSNAEFQRRTGVRIVRVATTAAGGLVDLRYQVIDSNAADTIHDPDTPPELVDERTHVVVNELFMGHSHHGQLKVAHTYYLIFNNPGNLLQAGTRVTVQLGAARIAHVPVR
jgi:hypothetical protein